jgi:hypothetical protein
MTARSVSFSAPFAWLTASVESLRTDPGTLFGATALLLAVVLVPTIAQQLALKIVPSMGIGTALAIQAVFSLVMLMLFPPVAGGYFRFLHARAQGQPVRATDVFALFREPAAARRMIATALIFTAIDAAAFIAANLATSGYVLDFFKIALTAVPGKPPVFPPPPSGFGLWFLLGAFLCLTLISAYNLAFTQAALGSRTALDAVGDGFAATVRNLAVFIVFYLAIFLAGTIFLLIFALVVGLVAMLLGFISPILALVVLMPIYLAMMLVMYIVMFGFAYQSWRATLGGDMGQIEQHLAA